MAELNTTDDIITTDNIIRESQSAKTELAERWSALQTAWARLKDRLERLFRLYEEQESSQNNNATQIRERDQEIQRLKDEIRETINQITELNPQLENMENEMDDITSRQFPRDRDQSGRLETEDVRSQGDGGQGTAAEVRPPPNTTRVRSDTTNDVPRWRVGGGGLTGGYRYKTPKNRRKTKSKSKTRSKSPSKSKKSKKSRRKSKY